MLYYVVYMIKTKQLVRPERKIKVIGRLNGIKSKLALSLGGISKLLKGILFFFSTEELRYCYINKC